MDNGESEPIFWWKEVFPGSWILLKVTGANESSGVGFAIEMDGDVWYWRTGFGLGYEEGRDRAMNATLASFMKGYEEDRTISGLLDDY